MTRLLNKLLAGHRGVRAPLSPPDGAPASSPRPWTWDEPTWDQVWP